MNRQIGVERRSTLQMAQTVDGIVVVIDVLRAFTCAALMFGYGIEELMLVATPEEALQVRRRDSSYLLAGEVGGMKIDGFDLGNSPGEIAEKGRQYFRGRKIVLRSSSGTQGAIAVRNRAQQLIIASYTTASAVARHIRTKTEKRQVVTLLGMGTEAKKKAVEDECCGDYIEHLLNNKAYDHVAAILECIHDPWIAKGLRGERPQMPREDIILSLQRDLFDFVMIGQPVGEAVIIKPIPS
jgi:2-phosphosulfolactate phosphatase